jgi:hypothetical protein
MTCGRIIATLAASALIAGAVGSAAFAQNPGQLYVLHSAPDGSCPALDWHVVVGADNTVSGIIAWNDMKSVAHVQGTLTAEKAFHLDATEIAGGGKTAVIDGTLIPGWLQASIKGPGVDCANIKIALFRQTNK